MKKRWHGDRTKGAWYRWFVGWWWWNKFDYIGQPADAVEEVEYVLLHNQFGRIWPSYTDRLLETVFFLAVRQKNLETSWGEKPILADFIQKLRLHKAALEKESKRLNARPHKDQGGDGGYTEELQKIETLLEKLSYQHGRI